MLSHLDSNHKNNQSVAHFSPDQTILTRLYEGLKKSQASHEDTTMKFAFNVDFDQHDHRFLACHCFHLHSNGTRNVVAVDVSQDADDVFPYLPDPKSCRVWFYMPFKATPSTYYKTDQLNKALADIYSFLIKRGVPPHLVYEAAT
jgi:hypothetical protein